MFYVRVDDPNLQGNSLEKVVRSDGKVLKHENAWKTCKIVLNDEVKSYLHIFDYNSTGVYNIIINNLVDTTDMPTMLISSETSTEG
jgi:hypothetical protein